MGWELSSVGAEPRALLELSWRGRDLARPLLIDAAQAHVFSRWLTVMNQTGVPYAVGGAYAVYAYTGGWRNTKDLDFFLRPVDLRPVLDTYAAAGYETEVRDRLWLAKVHERPFLLDLLFAVRHAKRLVVSDDWFETTQPALLLGAPTRLLSLEEVIATKVYLAARDRFDGADIVHLILAVRGRVDWQRIIGLLRGDEEILLWHLMLFRFVYPGHDDYLPGGLMEEVFDRIKAGRRAPRHVKAFRGLLLDPESFAMDVREWGYEDARDREPLVDCRGNAL